MLKEIINENCDLALALDNYFAQISPSEIMRILKDKDVKINGVKTGNKRAEIKVGDEITVYEKPNKFRSIYSVVYEDDDVLVADKESGVNSEGLFHFLQKKGDYRFVHRLDRNTCGLILFAKTDKSEKNAKKAIKEHRIKKVYQAVVCGTGLKPFSKEIAYLKKDAKQSQVTIFNKHVLGSVEIETDYTLKRVSKGLSLVEVELITGKTHQIRAHLAYLKHPILGDTKYGSKEINEKYKLKRQLLVSKRLTLYGINEETNGVTFESLRDFSNYLDEE